ncbi:hypothetical protein [Mycobacteroides chelonae]|uniref:hypothetical protein n=1 Tax=Mycobacteroides chelonae TaxID=1774 RepID=UPI0013F4DDCB|nr:hypothetical protein [Mycobacteroides chelonae]
MTRQRPAAVSRSTVFLRYGGGNYRAVPDDELPTVRIGARYPLAGVQAAEAAGQFHAGLAQAVPQQFDLLVELGLRVGVAVSRAISVAVVPAAAVLKSLT